MQPSIATIDLGVLVSNAQKIKRRVSPAMLMAIVKANAYGHGAVPVAKALENTVDYFGVVTVSEALELRNAGITKPILKLTVTNDEKSIRIASENQVSLTVADNYSLSVLRDVAAQLPGLAAPIPIHLKLDIGMGRIGVSPSEAVSLAEELAQLPNIEFSGIFAHLPCSDEAESVEITQQQIQQFADISAKIEENLGRPLLKHLAASGGIALHENSYFDMVRAGIAIYGTSGNPVVSEILGVTPSLTWESQLVFVKQVSADTAIGYGSTWTSDRPTWIGTLPIGYSDGLNRKLSNRGRVLINGRSYPIVGRVCMNQIMVDLGPAEAAPAKVGDRCVILGRDGDEYIDVAEYAGWMETIPYESYCLISSQVMRNYQN